MAEAGRPPGCAPQEARVLAGEGPRPAWHRKPAGLPAHPGPGPRMARPPHGSGVVGERAEGRRPPTPLALAQQWELAVPTQWKEPARLEVVLSLNHVKDLLTPVETGSGLRSFMDGAVWPLPLGSKASYRLNDA